jgi:trimeric autotransporter adhesin
MERKLFHKAKLATAIALVSTTTLLTGCLVDGDKSNTNSTTVQEDASRISITDQATPLAQILGLVQDTNGNPVAGASVSIGSATTTTDANGAYAISNVPVTGFTGSTGAATATALQVSIVPAAGYLSATVSVSPQASTIVQTIDGTTGNTEDALLAIVTTDGLAVSAGITVVPALQSTVTGILRNAENGLPVDGAVIGLELLGVNTVAQQQVQNAGAGTSYGVASYQAATDANGAFTFTNLPVDAEYDLAIEGWTFAAQTGGVTGTTTFGSAVFSTTPEVANQNIGTVTANLITSDDTVAPFVTSVNGVVVNAATGVLNDDLDGTQGLTINFSEPLQQIVDANSIYVYNTTLNAVIAVDSFALSADGTSLTITTTNPIAQDQTFEIYLSVVDFQDTSDNALAAVTTALVFQGDATPAYDTASGVTSVGTVKLTLKTFADPVTQAGAVVGLTQLLTDGGSSNFELLQTLNSTFADVDTGSVRGTDTTIEQLNVVEAETRLNALAATTYSESGLTSGLASVETNVARIQFSIDATTESDTYILALTNESGAAKNVNVVATALVGTVTNDGTQAVTLTLTDGFAGAADLLLVGVEPNDIITISSITSFGTVDGVASRPLTDQVAATTVLQNSYGQGLKSNATVGLNYGDGGELADLTPAALGAPILNITPRLLTPQAGGNLALPVGETWDAVQALMQDDVAPLGTQDVSLASIATGYSAYDAEGFAAWTVGSRKIGIAVSEDVSLTGTPTEDAGQVLTGWTAQNDVILNDLNVANSADLINVTVPDVIDFANNDHGSTIDFTGVMSDLSGNPTVAANNAKVVVRDLMPPLLASAVYNGEQIVLTYNENVVVPNGTVFTLDGVAGDLTITSSDTNTTVAGTTVTLNRADFPNLNSEAVFDRGAFDHDSNITTADTAHSVIYAADVEDALGTSWANWDGVANLVDIPGVAIRDDEGAFILDSGTPTAGTATTFTVTYVFSHRIDLNTSGFGAQSNTMTGAEVVAEFAVAGSTIDPTSSAVLDATGRALTVNFVTTAAYAPASAVTLSGGSGVSVISEWDTNDTQLTTLGSVAAP